MLNEFIRVCQRCLGEMRHAKPHLAPGGAGVHGRRVGRSERARGVASEPDASPQAFPAVKEALRRERRPADRLTPTKKLTADDPSSILCGFCGSGRLAVAWWVRVVCNANEPRKGLHHVEAKDARFFWDWLFWDWCGRDARGRRTGFGSNAAAPQARPSKCRAHGHRRVVHRTGNHASQRSPNLTKHDPLVSFL